MAILPTRRAALVALAAAVGLLFWQGEEVTPWVVVLIVTGGVLLLAVLDALVSTSPSKLIVQRRHPPVVVAGGSFTLEWTVRSEARRSLTVDVADQLAPSLRAGSRRFRLKVPPGGTAQVSTELHPLRRGRFELDSVTVRIAGRLGLGSRQREVPLATVLRVHPPFRSG